MNHAQTARLLAKVAAFDNRDVGDVIIAAWFEALGDLDFEACLSAVTFHFAESKQWLMPAHIREIVRPITERLPSARPLAEHFKDMPETDRTGPGYVEFQRTRARLRPPGDDPDEVADPVRARALDRARRERPQTPFALHRGHVRSDSLAEAMDRANPPGDTGDR